MIHMDKNDMVLYHRKESNLECRVRKLINQVTKSEYISPLKITHKDGIYTLRLGLNCKDAAPISLGYQGDEEGFLKFLEKEFRKRRLQDISYTTGVLINDNSDIYYPIIEL